MCLLPPQHVAKENAAFYAMLFGVGFPVRIRDWGSAALLKAEFDEKKQQADIIFDSENPFILTLDLDQNAILIINGNFQTKLQKGTGIHLNIPKGKTTLCFKMDK